MNQQPDKFFREKLEGFSKPVSSSAWSRVEANLDKKTNKPFWLKIAAGLIFLLGTSLFILIKGSQEQHLISATDQSQTHVSTEKQKQSGSIQTDDSIKAVAPANETPHLKQEALTPKLKVKKLNPVKHKTQISPSDEVRAQQPAIESIEVTKVEEHEKEVTELAHTVTLVSPISASPADESQHHAGIMLIYNADEVNEKYLDKKTLTQATPEDKKPSTFKKLLEKAHDLKHNQDPIGELRQKKNEILALNFKNEKQRSQNR
jgi:hypothetical protein